MTTIYTSAEWATEGARRFGDDTERWAFRCFMCGNEMSIARAKAEFSQLRGSGWRPESECIGRYIDVPAARMPRSDKPCDWCAYGLIGGPVTVTMENGKTVHVFDFARASTPTKSKEDHRG